MHESVPPQWGLDDFLDEIAEQLTRLGIAAPPPDRRTVRYYATLGTLDRPTIEGREARYGEHHLAQMLALKRLQAEGLRLAAIGPRIAGASTEDLMSLAAGKSGAAPPPAPPAGLLTSPDRSGLRTQSVLTLAPGVHLVLDDAELSTTEAAILRTAAAGLLSRITALGLTTSPTKE
ncbi:MAG TPA: MerR family transcriptional regulator [Propionibacterium sp.]|jgi:DNA-binding transcriptional MerR regulator|nr:MerR family transcriptional regulator [Propionibacterium sp.]